MVASSHSPSSAPEPSRDVTVLLTCGDGAVGRWGDAAALLPGPVRAVRTGPRPARDDVDPLLDGLPAGDGAGPGRLVVAGADAALAAVVVRLLRRERLDVEVALLPDPDSVAAVVWGIPTGVDAALAVAAGPARAAPLVRDDRGGVVVGEHRVAEFHGAVYADERLLGHGPAAGLTIRPDPDGPGVTARLEGPRRWLGTRPGRIRTDAARAVQVGCRPAAASREGVPDDRPVERRSWYRHVTGWSLVRPG